MKADRLRALGELCRLRSTKKLEAEKRPETHFLRNEEIEKWIEDYVAREASGARMRVQYTEVMIGQEQEDTETADNAVVRNRQPENTFHEMMVGERDILSDLASSENGEDRKDEDNEEMEQGNLSEEDAPSWEMGTMSKTVQQRMKRFWQK